jgi:transposase-like protein
MDETILPTWAIFIFVFVWLILPALIAYLHGRSWFRWLIIGAIFPIVCFIALAILPRPKDQKQKTESDSSTKTLIKGPPRLQRPLTASLLEGDNGKSIGSKDAHTSTVFDLSDQPIGSQEFKIEIASACEESNLNLGGFAEKYNIDPNVLGSWIDEYLGPDEANVEDTEPTELEKIGTLGSEDDIEVTQQTEMKVEQKEPGNGLATQPSVPTSIATSGSLSLWLDENQNIEDQPQGVFAMSITNFQVEGPDDDGDISLEIEFKLENTSETEITLVKKTLVLEQSKVGALAGEVNDKEECLLDPGDSLDVSTWTRVHKNCFDQTDSSLYIKFFTSFYSSEFYKFTDIEIPNEANQTKSIIENVSSELLEPSIKISIMRTQEVPYDEDEDDPEEDKLEIKISLENKSSIYMEDIEANLVLLARNGAEIEETSDQLEVLAPHSGALLQPTFWGIKRSKLRDAKINLSIKTNKLVGTRILRETKAWTG